MPTDRPMGRPPYRASRRDVRIQLDEEVADRLREQSHETGVPQWQIIQDALMAAWAKEDADANA